MSGGNHQMDNKTESDTFLLYTFLCIFYFKNHVTILYIQKLKRKKKQGMQ